MRFSAIIIDDEPSVCSLLKALGKWEQLSIDIAAVCHDGEDAFSQIKALRPDIAITDIRMPCMDGLELIAQTKRCGIETEFVILSGYGLFEYAQKAMSFGVNHYLLKPIEASQLNQILEDLCRSIALRRKMQSERQKNDAFILSGRLSLQRRGVEKILGGADVETMEGFRKICGTELPETGSFRVIALSFSQPALHTENSAFLMRVQALCGEHFSGIGKIELIQNPGGLFGFLLLNGTMPQSALIDVLSSLRKPLDALQEIFGSFHYALALSEEASSAAELCREVRRTEVLLKCRAICGEEHILTADSCSACLDTSAAKQADSEMGWSDLAAYLEMLSEERLRGWFTSCRKRCSRPGYCSVVMLEKLERTIRNAMSQTAESLGAESCLAELDNAFSDRIRYANGLRNFFAEAEACCVQWIQAMQEYRQNMEAAPIRSVKIYVMEHLQYSITLEEAAAYANYSPAYFSTLFRKETGMNFKDYLLKVRLDRAKEYLRKTDESIISISQQLGFSSDKYFRKVFKKETGVKAQEYRNLYR